MFFPLNIFFISFIFSTFWILSQQRISTLSCLLCSCSCSGMVWLLRVWVCVCLFFFPLQYECVSFVHRIVLSFRYILSVCVSCVRKCARLLLLSLSQCRCFRLLGCLFECRKMWFLFFWFCFLNLLSIQYLNLILLSFVFLFGLMAEFVETLDF